MNVGAAIALIAAAGNFSAAALQIAISRAPGWRAARLFAALALTAGIYNVLSAVLCIADFSATTYIAAGQFSYFVATAHCVLWVLYAYSDRSGSLTVVPVAVRGLAVFFSVAAAVFAATGWLLKAQVSVVEIPWARLRYHYPVTTMVGDIYGMLLAGLLAISFLRLIRRYRGGEGYLRWQLVFFGVFFVCAADELLVANRVVEFASLLDCGFLFVVMPLAWQTIGRITNDARRLSAISDRLEQEVARRTEERDHAQKALVAAEQHTRELLSGLEAIVWEADATTLKILYVSGGAEKLLGYRTEEWLEGQEFWRCHLHPKDRDATMQVVQETLTFGRVHSAEYRMKAADGRMLWFRDTLHPVPGRNGVPERLRGIMVDVTESRRAHEALLESEERFRSLFENATVGLYRTTPDGRILMVNPVLLGLLGYESLEELTKRNLEEEGFEPGYSRSAFREMLESQGIVRGLEAAWTRRDGSVVFVRESARAVRGADGAVLYYDGIVEDFTQRKLVEDALRESEERFRAIFQQAAVGVAQISLDEKVQLANDRYCEVVGRTLEELARTSPNEFTHPEDAKVQFANTQRLLAGKVPSFSMEKRYLRNDGTISWAKLYASLVRDGSDRPKYYIAAVEDITERKQAEAALIESEQRFRNMADIAPVLIWLCDTEGHLTFVNRQALIFSGCTMEQLTGGNWWQFVHPDDIERVRTVLFAAIQSQRSDQLQFRLLRGDGEYRWVLNMTIPRFAGAQYAGHIGTVVDITELKRDQEQALATQKLESLGVLAGGIAHDFNNLLGSILTDSELVLEELLAGTPAHEGARRINAVAVRAAEIVRQLLAYAGHESATFEPVDLSLLVSEMLELLKVSISKHVVLQTSLAGNLAPVRANAAQIQQVVMNLVINASEAIGEREGVIRVAASRVVQESSPDVFLRLEVSDTGPGMPDEIRARIFDPFFTTKFPGRGLGLAAVQGIIRRHRGSITVVSTPGQGTRFEILLPCTAQPPQNGVYAERSRSTAVESFAGTVLVVEDEDALRFAVSKMLQRKGFSVIEAADGARAVDLFRTNEQDIGVVLLDMTLPGIGGGEVFAELQRIRPGVKVVLTTAYSQEMARAAVGGDQAWAFIRKPYRGKDLAALLGDALMEQGSTES
jgi:PAS domain S-box-containing protein